MATVANTRAALGTLLKTVYEPSLNEGIRNQAFFLKSFTARKYDGKGKEYKFATHLAFNQMVAARAADDYFESGQPETVYNGTINPAYIHIPFEITHDLMVASKGDKHAFADGMSLVQDTAQTVFKRDLNRVAIGDGRGILATLTDAVADGGTAAVTVTVDTTKFLADGMLLDIWNGVAGTTARKTGGALDANGQTTLYWFKVVTVLSETQFTMIEVDASGTAQAMPAGIVAGDVLIRKKNAYYLVANGARKCYEPSGLRLMADDGTLDPAGGYLGISASAVSLWKGITRDAAGADVSPAIVSAIAMLYRRWSNTMMDTIWCHGNQGHGLIYGTEGSYKDKRFVDAEPTRLGANEEDVVINVHGQRLRIRMDDDLPDTELNCYDSKVIRYVELYGIELLEQADGQYLTPWRDSTGQRHAQVGFWGWSGNWGTVMRNGICRIYGLSRPASLPVGW
jgi:hypothetical protein